MLDALLTIAATIAVIGAVGAVLASAGILLLHAGHALAPSWLGIAMTCSIDVAVVGIGAFAGLLSVEAVVR